MTNVAKTNEVSTLQISSGQRTHPQMEKMQQELQLVNQQLKLITRARKSTEESELEHNLFEKRICIQVKLKQWKEVVEDGYKILGKKGPSVIVYKCILVGLCRLGRYDDEVDEVLDVWSKATPKCRQMQQCKEKMNYYLNAIKSGLEPAELFKNLEEALGLNADWVFNEPKGKIVNGQPVVNGSITSEKHHWTCRPPPTNGDAPFYLCPRGVNSCMYGDACIAAHSKEELEEWMHRKAGFVFSNNIHKHTEEKQKIESIKNTDENTKLPLPELSSAVNLLKELPSFAFHYLVDINKRITEAKDIRTLFAEDLPNVKFLCKSPLNIVKMIPIADLGTSTIETSWTFVLSTKAPMRNVCLLEDCHRECFRITTGKFIDSSKTSINLIDLHDMNALQDSKNGVQVLNTFIPLPILYQMAGNWPDWFFYKIEVTFRQPPLKYGTFVQSVMFDMKYDPKLIKHLTVQVIPEENKQVNNLTNSQDILNKEYNTFNMEKDYKADVKLNATSTDVFESNLKKNRKQSSEEINGYNSKYGYAYADGTTLPIPSTSKINGISNDIALHGNVSNGYVSKKHVYENEQGQFGDNGQMKNSIMKPTLSNYNLQNGNPQHKDQFQNITKDLMPSQYISNSKSGNKHFPDKKATSNDSMPSLFEQDVKSTVNQGYSSLRGSTLSLRSESPSSTCTISSSSSGESNFKTSNSNNTTAFPCMDVNKPNKDSEWLKVQKSNKKTKYVPDNQEILDEDAQPPGLTTETKIGFLQEMGFDRRSAIKALQFCNKDLERSVEWLISGEEKRRGHGHSKQSK